MGYSKLCLLLLLSSYTLAQDSNDNIQQPCLLASRFKAYRKYMYEYTTESSNGAADTTDLRNGLKVSCQVEIEVPQMCKFIMHTRDCVLSESSVINPRGELVYKQAPNAEAFQTAMGKNPLKFTSVHLYPETDEPVNILNIKRGIISALMVPFMEDEQNSLVSTVHGQCSTDYVVNARRDIATDVTLSRDLSQCDQFHSRELASSPLALLQKLHRPLSKLITSTQECHYHFDNKGKHITAATCREKHIYLPFSHEDNGLSSMVTQQLNFQGSKSINNRVFDVNHSQTKPLHFEDPDDKSPIQTKDTALSIMRDIMALPDTDQGQKRTNLFHKLVSRLRTLKNDTLSPTVTEMFDMSGWLTWQVLFQCGTSECTSAILQTIRTLDGVSLEMDALVYGLSLQAKPNAARVRDMLSIAQYKQSKAIMYALANTVRKFHEGGVTPVVTDVSKFMETLLNDCSGEMTDFDADIPTDPEELAFLVLRVVGVMGPALQTASPSLISSILRCVRKTDIPLSNQKAAIQAFRLMDITDEIRNVLMEVFQDIQSPVEKRVAAYLILMKNPDHALVRGIVSSLENMKEEQLKSFVVTHLKNICNSDSPQMVQFREYIEFALGGMMSDGMSQNYKINSPMGLLQSNIIFNDNNILPKEVMLETTLKVFDFNYDIFEVGVEGTGFEPTIDALFGEKGFFPDSISKIMYWAGDKTQMLGAVLDRVSPDRGRMKPQVPQDLLEDITQNAQRLLNDVRFSPAPEAIAYLRLLGNEIGYMKTGEIRKMAETLLMYYHVFIKVLPAQAFSKLMSSTENEVFAHYIFMENAFSLPTASGLPLKFSLVGVFAPGAKGGLTPSLAVTDLSFMPSVGLEFITHMGVHIPDYVEAGLEMHTNMYSESSVNAKVTIKRNQMRLSISAPKSNTQLFSISNKLLSVSSGQNEIVPSLEKDQTDSTDCQPLISGLKLCTVLRYSNTTSLGQALYYPLHGETRFAIEIQPTGGISEYTATITDETLREGKKARHKVESLKLTLKAEGDDSTEVSAALKYNRNKNTFLAEVIIPDFDVEAGIKLAVDDSNARGNKMRGITIDVTNKNIPQLTLVGRARLGMMKDAMMQLQMAVPSLKTDASFTATLKRDGNVLMDLETVISMPETSYTQKSSIKYDDDKFELEQKSDLKSEFQNLIPNVEDHHRQLQQFIDHILDQRVAMTDMKYRHIVSKGIEAGNIWLDKLTAHANLPNLRSKRSFSDLTLPALPEKLFLQSDSLFRYQFNKDKMAILFPLPLGGKNSEQLNIPTSLSIPLIDLPEIGIYIPAKNLRLPSFTIPPSLDFTVPLLGLVEASTKITSNLYSWEGSISGGNNTVDVPNYIGQFKAVAQSPFNLLAYRFEGTGMMSGRPEDNIKYLLNSSFSHCLIDTSFSVSEMLRVANYLYARANYKIEALSPIGLEASLYYSAQSTSSLESDDVSGDGTVEGLLKLGSFCTNTSYTHNYNLRLRDREGRGESSLHFNSPFIEVHNMIHGVYANSELNIVSKTNAQKDILRHVAELKYKDAQLTLKSNADTTVMGKSINNKVELGVSNHMALIRIESQADDDTNRAYSLITGALDSNGAEVNSEGSLTFDTGHRGLHKASVMIRRNGLTTSGTNSIQCSPVTVENIFNGALDNNGATLSSRTKVMAEESRGELNIEGTITAVEASLNGVLTGHVLDATTRNDMNIVLNKRALTFTSNTMGTLKKMNTENYHKLSLALWTFALQSKTNNFISDNIYYKQGTKVDVKPFVMSFDMTNDFKFHDASLNSESHIKVEPIKADLSGSMRGAYGEKHNIKNTFELNYDNLAGAMKYSTSGNIMDTKIYHSCDLEFAGLSSKSNCETQLSSEPLRFDITVRTMALPFSLTVDALVNSDGDIYLDGKHTGQLYSKLLVKADPLALAYSHDSRISTTNMFPSGESSTNIDNNFKGLLTPSDQSFTWTLKSRLNDQAYNQDISTYNNPEKIGFEFSGVILTDLFSKFDRSKRSLTEIREYSLAGALKYDKNSDCHIIQIPFIESFPVAFEHLKNTLQQALDSLQQFILKLDVNQLIIDLRAKLDRLPMHVSDFMQQMDFKNKINQVKAKFNYLIDEFSVTMDDMEDAMTNLRNNLENTLINIATKVRDLILTVRDYAKSGNLAGKITDVLSQIGNQLLLFDNKYDIKHSLVKVLDAIEDIIRQTNLQKLTGSSGAWLQKLDSKYSILDKFRDQLTVIKQTIENLDIRMFLQDVNDYIISIELAMFVEQLLYTIPSSEISKVIESMNDVIVNWIDEYEIPHKLNAVYFYIRDLLLRYHLDVKFKELMDQLVILINELEIDETLQTMVGALKTINFELFYDKIVHFLRNVSNQLRSIDFKKSIDYLNEYISSIIMSMKEFDYEAFVDKTNQNIAELTNYINKELKKYEVVQKIEAVREFFREVQNSVFTYLDELKNTKVADALKKLKKVIDSTFYNDLKMKVKDILEDMRQRILDMDIKHEIYIYLQRASESFNNIVTYISVQVNRLIEKIGEVTNDKIISQIKQVVNRVLERLKRAEIEVPTFILPLTDLVIPAFTINLNKLQEISLPSQIPIPEITILDTYKIPAFVIDFDEIKAKLVSIIDDIKYFEIQTPHPGDIFGDLKLLYLSKLPDLTFPEITLSEIKFPAINIPTLNMNDFEITMLPIPEIKLPEVPSDICIPVFGKLHGEFRINTPLYTLVTTGKIENSTSIPKHPKFTATITSHAKSDIDALEHTLEVTAQLEAPRMKKMIFLETVKAAHMVFSIDHQGSLTITGSSAEASCKTTTKATAPMYSAVLLNNMSFTLNSGISAAIDTTYDHNLYIPLIETSSQASMKHNIAATMKSGGITVIGETTGNGKWSIRDYSDGGTHKSNLQFDIDFSTAKLTFVGETNCTALTSKQTLTAESVILSHIMIEGRSETEVPSFTKSVMVLNGEAHIGDLKVALTASHDAEFTGILIGPMANSLEFMIHPFEIEFKVNNKMNSKILFPLKLTGKMDLQHDYGITLNSKKQITNWFALARFNQYKYSHNLTAENNEMDISLDSSASGDANLDFLTVPLSIPNMTIPYLQIQTPEIRDLSLWEHAGFNSFLFNPQQSFDMNLKLHYYKNPNVHTFELDLEPIYSVITDNANTIQVKFGQYRDNIVTFLKQSYNQAKSQYIKYKIDTSSMPPRIFTVPGYKIPIMNIEVSAFRAEMPAFSYFVPREVSTPSFKIPALGFSVPTYTVVLPSLEFPVIHVPETLSEMKLPTFTPPAIQNRIAIPAMGNITCDFSFKSTLITLNANAGLNTQADVVARFGASSTSLFDILNGQIDGTTSLTQKRGIKLATTVSLEHNNMEANHECALSLNKRSLDVSVVNTAKINFPIIYLELNQEFTGNTKNKPTIALKKNLKYMFNIPLIESVGKGNLAMNWALEALSSYVSLETSTQGKSDITVCDSNFAIDIENEVNFYINANGLRTTASTALNSSIDKQEIQKLNSNNNIFHFDLNKSMALEVTLRRLFATVDYRSNNNVASFNTNGKHVVKGELDFVPLTTFTTTINIDASQPSSLGYAGLIQSITLSVSPMKQSFTWSGNEQLASLIHTWDLLVSNDESEVHMDLTGSVEGHTAFLKAVELPVYQKTLWDVLKFNEVTNMDNLQFLNISSSIVYTKNMDGQEYTILSKLFENGIVLSIPEINIAVPSWVKQIPNSIRNIDMQFDIPDNLTLPPAFFIPEFNVPFTNLHVDSFTIDPKNLRIPEVITTTAFEIMLPGLPTISVPSYDVRTEYLQGKLSFLSFKIPQYEITVSSFTVPKSVSFGRHTISLNEITSQMSNFELPTIVIPEQNIEIPESSFHLPTSVYIPAFGALSATLKVSSPIYNVSTTANLEKKNSSFVMLLNSICTSTIILLEYDLSATATIGFDNGGISLNGKCNLIHNDVNMDWTHSYAQNLRRESRHTLNVDITSKTFFDMSYRFASRKDGITASISSPSSGFLGLYFQRKSQSQLLGKLFCHYLSTPEKDIDVVTTKATLKNSQKLILQTSWNWDFLHDVIEGTKDRIPAMTEAVLKFINKYHTAHFGFDLNRGGMKLKNTVSNGIERAYHEVPVSFNTLQSSIKHLGDEVTNRYRKASDGFISMRIQTIMDRLAHRAGELFKYIENRMYASLHTVKHFLRDVWFTVPGYEEKLSGVEVVRLARQSISRATERAIQRIVSLTEKIYRFISRLEFHLPGNDIVGNDGNEIMDKLTSAMAFVYDQLTHTAHRWFNLLRKTLRDLAQVIGEKEENLIIYLQDQNIEIASHIDAAHAEILQTSRQHIEEAKRCVAKYKDHTKLKIQEAYNAFNMERVNNDTKEVISIFQSHLYGGLNEAVDLMRRTSQSTAPYIKVSNAKMEMEIPLPFFWKSFSEWPKQYRH